MKQTKWPGILLMAVIALLSSYSLNAQIHVAAGQTAQALAQMLTGQGVTISGATLNCPGVANGIFKVTSSNIGLDSGIVLTTGRAATQGTHYGVNGYTTYLASNNNGAPGDASLTLLAGQQTQDACALEFDVVPNGDTLRFRYIFSSEEYINAVCGPYNDAFAFFISGPGISGTDNMALVPGTNIPVTINTINNGIPGSTGDINNCLSMGNGSPFTAYYINNMPGATLTHQGFTTVLQAIHGVTPCASYHLKMVIADAGNGLYDSGVFLKAGSLQTGNYNIKALASVKGDTAAFCVKACLPGVFEVKRTQVDADPQTIQYSVKGSAQSGIDYSPLTGSVTIAAHDSAAKIVVHGLRNPDTTTKELKLLIYSPFSCSGISMIVDSAVMTLYDTARINMLTPDSRICRKDSMQLQVAGYDFLNYHWQPENGLSDPNTKDPKAAPLADVTYTVTASLQGSSCLIPPARVAIAIRPTPIITMPQAASVCYNQRITLPSVINPPSTYFSYTWQGPDGFSSTLASPETDNMVKANEGDYYLTATNDTNGCKDHASVHITVQIPDTPAVASPQVFCLNSPDQLLKAEGDSIRWYSQPTNDDTGSIYAPLANTARMNDYLYYVARIKDGCASPRVPIEVVVKKCCDGRIFIPNAFTPNNDGNNDVFETVTDYGYTINNFQIFNRWGQTVYTGLRGKWDGTFGGVPAEVGTYFYLINFSCIQGGTVNKAGEVILIR